MQRHGKVQPGETLYFPFETFDGGTGASITMTGLAVTDIEVYKNGGVTQRSSDSGFTLLDTDGTDFDTITGIHGFSIDLADNTDAGFYSAGAFYMVVVSTVTVDAQTVSFIAGTFSIGEPGSLLDTTIATLASQTSFTLSAGSSDDDAYNGCICVVTDVASKVQKAIGHISDYTGSTKTVTLAVDPGVFTMAATDNISILAPTDIGRLRGSPIAVPTTAGVLESDVTHIAGSAVSTTSAQIGVNVVQVSGDATAADNLESQYDGTGLTGSTYPATQAQVDSIGSVSGGGFPYEMTGDNTGGAIKGASFVGTQTGTYTATEADDGNYHQIDDTGDAIDIVYQTNVTGANRVTEFIWKGYVSGGNDVITVQMYDYVGADWETRGTINGQAGTDNVTMSFRALAKHTGTGADVGGALIRFVCSGQSNPTLYTDELVAIGVSLGQSVGYALGAVWVDTVSGTAGTVDYVNGTADNPCLTLADAITVAASVGLTKFVCAAGSTITFAESHTNELWIGHGTTFALGGQDLSNTHIFEGSVSGTATSPSGELEVHDCELGNCTVGQLHAYDTSLEGDLTLTAASDYMFANCRSAVAGTGAPSIDFGAAVGNTNVNFRNYSGGIEVKNMGVTGTDNMTLEGNGQLVVNANCTGGTITLRGNFRITDNSSGAVNIIATVPTIDIVDQGTAQGSGTGNNQIQLAATASATDGQYDPGIVQIVTGTGAGQTRAIIEYDGTTKIATVDKDWRTNPDTTSSYMVKSSAGGNHVNEGLAQGGTSTTITLNAAADGTNDDIYVGQTVFIRSGTGQDQARIITDYTASTRVATVHRAWEVTPDTTSGYVMLPLPAIGNLIATIPTDVWDLADGIETGYTPRETMRAIAAAIAGAGDGSSSNPYQAIDGSKNRVQFASLTNGLRATPTIDVT